MAIHQHLSADSAAAVPQVLRYDAERLIGTGSTAQIILGDKTYILRITRQGKLILTK